jgi:hypothetical protein
VYKIVHEYSNKKEKQTTSQIAESQTKDIKENYKKPALFPDTKSNFN